MRPPDRERPQIDPDVPPASSHPAESESTATDRSLDDRIHAFLGGAPHVVVGASADRAKYGNIVLRAYLERGRPVIPVNPRGGEIEGLEVVRTLAALTTPVHGASIVTPPDVTEAMLPEIATAGIRHVWMQPGAEFPGARAAASALGLECIAGDACILVVMR